MITDAPNLNILWSELIVEELVRNGVDRFVVSPGSRSTPLTVAAARNPNAKTTVHYDERGAAFFALGVAKALGKPCALICTSGTAVANYFPAIVEASMSYVPLIVLTADRPPELQNTGANQTINQTNIYGEYVRHFVAMPCPDKKAPLEFVLTTIDESVAAASRTPWGPAHINCAFREPLAPTGENGGDPSRLEPIRRWIDSAEPYTKREDSESCVYRGDAEIPIQQIRNCDRLLYVVGQQPDGDYAKHQGQAGPLLEVLHRRPVFADVASDARCAPSDSSAGPCVANYDLLLLSPRFRALCAPDAVVHLGGSLVSKRLSGHLASLRPTYYVRVTQDPRRSDPTHRATHQIRMSARAFAVDMSPEVQGTPSEWPRQLADASRRGQQAVDSMLRNESRLTEPLVADLLGRIHREENGGVIFAGNSMPIRYLDMYGGHLKSNTRVVANRGASGIDGNIATAAGYAKASGDRVTALVGDLAALHDLGSLALLKQAGARVTLVIFNNDGGGIFHFLPIAEHKDVFERYFATPHGLHFEDTARMFGLPYARPTTRDEFVEAFRTARDSRGSSIIEVVTDREENVRLHRKIGDAVVKALEDF